MSEPSSSCNPRRLLRAAGPHPRSRGLRSSERLLVSDPDPRLHPSTGRPGRSHGLPPRRTSRSTPTCFVMSARSSGRTSSSTARSRSTPPSARCASLRTLTGITLPRPRRAKQRKRGCALVKLANLYRSLSLACISTRIWSVPLLADAEFIWTAKATGTPTSGLSPTEAVHAGDRFVGTARCESAAGRAS